MGRKKDKKREVDEGGFVNEGDLELQSVKNGKGFDGFGTPTPGPRKGDRDFGGGAKRPVKSEASLGKAEGDEGDEEEEEEGEVGGIENKAGTRRSGMLWGKLKAMVTSQDFKQKVAEEGDREYKYFHLHCKSKTKAHDVAISCMILDEGRDILLTGADDGKVKLWGIDVVPPSLKTTFSGHKRAISSIALDKTTLFVGSYDQRISIWDLISTRCERVIKLDAPPFAMLVYEGDRLFASAAEGTIAVFDVDTYNRTHTLYGHRKAVNTMKLYEGSKLVTSSADWTLRVWSADTLECLVSLAGHTNAVSAFDMLDSEGRAFSISLDRTLRVWDLSAKESTKTLGEALMQVEAHRDGIGGLKRYLESDVETDDQTRELAEVQAGMRTGIYDKDENKNREPFPLKGKVYKPILPLDWEGCRAVHASPKALYVGSRRMNDIENGWDMAHYIKVYETSDLRALDVLEVDATVTGMADARDYFYSVGVDGYISVWSSEVEKDEYDIEDGSDFGSEGEGSGRGSSLDKYEMERREGGEEVGEVDDEFDDGRSDVSSIFDAYGEGDKEEEKKKQN
uniref:Guanine nucleotide-binding protein subunit beta-like protein n=2 Tax=Palpitomonas bilix TaxID=652834 RepID=A0A7S3GL28_9EUKA